MSPTTLHRHVFAGLFIILFTGAVSAQEPDETNGTNGLAGRPNVIVILVDELRWDALGVTGHPFVETPNIDRLADEGAVFRNAFVTTPLCSPARASFLTGQYARAHGITTNNDPNGISHELVTFPQAFESSGYDTAFIGKWHMGEDDTPRPGFTHWIAVAGQGRYADPEVNINGRRTQASGHLTDLLVGYADDFVRTAARGSRPFLLYLSHKAVHEPGDPPRRHRGWYTSARVPCSPGCEDTLEGKLALTRAVDGTEPPRPGSGPDDPNIRGQMRRLPAVDDGVGQLRRTLEEEGVLDNTMIVFTSDNGYLHREHALGDKRWAYDESLRIPLIMRFPRRIRAGTIGLLTLNVDLAPTLLELVGLPVPANVHGRSLLPLLGGNEEGWRGSFVAEYFPEIPFPRVPQWEAIRTGNWKYVRYPELGPDFDELYNLASDPFELSNLALLPAGTDARTELAQQMDRGFEDLKR